MRRDVADSVVLLIVVAVLILRPWENRDPGPQEIITTTVTRVVDGDTFEVLVDGRVEDVRLIGIDTPETVKPGAPVECFGPQASAFAHRELDRRRVRLVLGEERRDRFGRLLAYAYLGDRFVNAEMVEGGYAQTLTIPPNDRYASLLKRLELDAARAGRGLWGACPP